MSSQSLGVSTSPILSTWNLNEWVFDAFLRMHHHDSLTITQHPVQTGAAITDHSFVNPKRFSFEIGMTDVAQSKVADQFPASPTRSIRAYDILVNLMENRQPLYLVSKYGYFENILIESIDVPDNWETVYSLFATVNLVQIIMVDVQRSKTSSVPQLTDATNRGQVNGQVPNQSDLSKLSEIIFGNPVLLP